MARSTHPESSRPTPPQADEGLRDFLLLDAAKILATAIRLEQRIRERFPRANLTGVGKEVVQTAREAAVNAAWLARPLLWLRTLSVLGVGILLVVVVRALTIVQAKDALYSSIADFLQGLDAAINGVVLLGAAIYFVATLESRLKRRRALTSLHRLRSLAHIIDMHQLTKDPDRVGGSRRDTPASPQPELGVFELIRYLDYCAEMLALLSKLAALHVQRFNDPVTLSAVNDIENLTSDLSRKVWQKIMILDRFTTETER